MTNLLKRTSIWLDTTYKNEYWYTHLEGIGKDNSFAADWHENYLSLRDTMNNTWTREEYTNWVRTWKLVYSKLTTESQGSKKFRSSNRIVLTISPVSANMANVLADRNLENFRYLRLTALRLLNLRAEAKVLAEEAYLATHPEKVLAVA